MNNCPLSPEGRINLDNHKIIKQNLKNFLLSPFGGWGAVGLALILFSCTYDKPIAPSVSCNNSSKSVSFSQDIQPIFTNNCNNVGCHRGNSPAGNLNLEEGKAYTQLSKTGSGYIDVTEPNNSVLLSAMLSTSNPMPPSGKLDNCTIDLIRTWMKQGGLNN